MDKIVLQQIINRIPLLKCRHRGSFPSDDVPTLHIVTFAIINTQPSSMQGERWILFANRVNFCLLQTLFSQKILFPLAALRTDDARTTTVPSQCLRFLHDICSFSSLRIPSRRNYMNSGG